MYDVCRPSYQFLLASSVVVSMIDGWLVGGWSLRWGSSGVVDLLLLKSILLFVTQENAYLLDGKLLA
jgi:hypothetical protein